MGTQSSHYCYCNKVITLNKDILLTSSTEPIIKLQSNFRGFLYRKNHLSFTSKRDLNSTSSQNIESPQIKEISMSYSTELFDSYPIIKKLCELIPKFELDEKETYLVTTSSLKTKAIIYENGSIYKGMLNGKNMR